MKTSFSGEIIIFSLLVYGSLGATELIGQNESKARSLEDPFRKIVNHLELNDETIFEGMGKLGEKYDIGISLEMPINKSKMPPFPPFQKFKKSIDGKTIKEAFDWFCEIDQNFVWSRDGNMANVYPRSTLRDSKYLFKLKLDEISFDKIDGASAAILQTINAVKSIDPAAQMAIQILGSTLQFDSPWSVALKDVTVRQVFNAIAARLGPTWGWVSSGVDSYKFMRFHIRWG
jgi:hypothetical protein